MPISQLVYINRIPVATSRSFSTWNKTIPVGKNRRFSANDDEFAPMTREAKDNIVFMDSHLSRRYQSSQRRYAPHLSSSLLDLALNHFGEIPKELANTLRLESLPEEDDPTKRSSRHMEDPKERLWVMLGIDGEDGQINGLLPQGLNRLIRETERLAPHFIKIERKKAKKRRKKSLALQDLVHVMRKRFIKEESLDQDFVNKVLDIYDGLQEDRFKFHLLKLLIFCPKPEQLVLIIDTFVRFREKYEDLDRSVAAISSEYYHSFVVRKPLRSFLFEVRVLNKFSQIDGVEIIKISKTYSRRHGKQEVDLTVKISHPETGEEYLLVIEIKSGQAKMKRKQYKRYRWVSQSVSGAIFFFSQKVFQSTPGIMKLQDDAPVAYAPYGALHMVTSDDLIELFESYFEALAAARLSELAEDAA